MGRAAYVEVLVAGGTEGFRSAVAGALSEADPEAGVVTAARPDDALDALEGVACVISGVDVAGEDGVAFVERVRERAPAVPCLRCVPTPDGTAVEEGFAAGATDVVAAETEGPALEALAHRALGLARRHASGEAPTAPEEPDAGGSTVEEAASVDERLAGADLATATSPGAVREALAEAAERLLGGDAAVLDPGGDPVAGPVDDPPSAVTDPPTDGDAVVVSPDDDRYESGIHVAYGEGTTLALLAEDEAAFDEEDATLAELLASLAAATVDRLRMQSTLRTERDRYSWLFENTSDAVARVEFEGEKPFIVAVNDVFDDVFVESGTDPIGEHLDDVVAEGERREAARRISRKVKRGELLEGVLTRDTEDGQRDFVWRSIPLREDGEVYGAYAIYTDIDEQKRRERQLRGLTQAARGMLAGDDVADVVAAIDDVEGEDVAVPSVALYCHEDGELRREGDGDLDPGIDDAVVPGEGPVGRAFEDGAAVGFEEGERRFAAVPLGDHGVLVAAVPDRSEEDVPEIARTLATTVEAALDRIERERLLREREAELEDERDRLAALFENIPDPALSYVIEDDVVRVRDVNSAFEEVMGYDAEEVVGEDINDFIVPPERADEATDLDDRARRGERIHTEVRRTTAHGERDFLLRSVPMELDDHGVQGYSIYTDLTQQKRRQRDLERQNERLDEFASAVAHDLKNPLTIASTYVEMAIENDDTDPLTEAAESIDRMSRLIDDVLALARQGRTVEDPEPVALESVVRESWSVVSAGEATLERDGSLGRVSADGARLREAFENLFRNAVEHVGADVTVTVGDLNEGGFYVADDGPGIPEDERDQVFEHGYTTDEDGTGFGLAIVESIVEAHDWTIDLAESAAGGTRFEVRIPAADRLEARST